MNGGGRSPLRRWWERMQRLFPLEWPRFYGLRYWLLKGWQRGLGERERHFLLGLPALTLALYWAWILLVFSAQSLFPSESYSRTAEHAFAQEDFDAARLAYIRVLAQAPVYDQKALFGLALSLRGLRQQEQALTLLNALAPPESSGYPPAHLLLARSILAAPFPSPVALLSAQHHLSEALSAQTNSAEAQDLLGRVYAQQGQPEAARIHLLKAEPIRPEAGVVLARIARQQGNEAEAQRWAKAAIENFQRRTNRTTAERVEAHIRCAESRLILRQYPEAVAELSQGYRETGQDLFKAWLGTAYAEWMKAAAHPGGQAWPSAFELLEKGLANDPENEDLQQELIRMSQQDGPQGSAAKKTLEALLASGMRAARFRVALGLDALRRQDLPMARQQILDAARLAPDEPLILNYKALILSISSPPDLPQALSIIQSLVGQNPSDPRFHETRAQVFFQLKRYREAIADAEFVLGFFPASKVLHLLLAQAYRQLGESDIAGAHQRQAERLPD